MKTMTNNNTPQVKTPKNQNRRAALGRPAMKLLGEGGGGGGGGGGLELVCGRPTLALGSALVHQTKQLRTTNTKRIKHNQIAKREAGIEGQVATMLKSHTRQIDTTDTTAMKRGRKKGTKNKRPKRP